MSRFLAATAVAAGAGFGLSRSAARVSCNKAENSVYFEPQPKDDSVPIKKGETVPYEHIYQTTDNYKHKENFKAPSKYSKAYETYEKPALGTEFAPLKLGEVINLTSETAIFRFLLPKATDVYQMTACSTLQAMDKAGVNPVDRVQRMYTPISPNGTKGYFDLIVKKQKHGRMTEHLFSMNPGESLLFRVVDYKMKFTANRWNNIGFIGTGSGITPLLQVIRAALEDPADKTQLSLLFANPSQRRVLVKGVIDELAAKSNGRFKPTYIIDHIEAGDRTASGEEEEKWTGLIGRINASNIRATMPPPAIGNMLMVCGNDQLIMDLCGTAKYVMKSWSSGLAMQPAACEASNLAELSGTLKKMGYEQEMVYRF